MSKARQVIRTETVTIEEPKSYLVTRTDRDGFTGTEKFVQFRDSKGVLDIACIHRERPDWVENVAGELIQRKGNPLSSYVEFWERRNAVIEEITPEQAKEFRAWFESEARKDIDRLVAITRAKRDAKSRNIEGDPKEQALIAAARAAHAGAPMPAWAKPAAPDPEKETAATGVAGEATPAEGAAFIPPHESGEMMKVEPATGGGGTGGAA